MKYGYFFYVIIGFCQKYFVWKADSMIFFGRDVQTESEWMETGKRLMHLPVGGAFVDTGSSGRSGKGSDPGCAVCKRSGNKFLDVCAGNGCACSFPDMLILCFRKRHGEKGYCGIFGVLIGLLLCGSLWQL